MHLYLRIGAFFRLFHYQSCSTHLSLGPKKKVLFPEIARVRIYIFCFKKSHTQTKKFPPGSLFQQIYVLFPSKNEI